MGDKKQYIRGDDQLPTGDFMVEWTEEKMLEIAKCSKDITYFAENHFWIRNPDLGRHVIQLFDNQRDILKGLQDNRFVSWVASRQIGKALGLDTPIPTPNGFKNMGDLVDGDQVFGSDGKVCNVVKAHEVRYNRKCYEMIFSNNEKIVADEEHNWFTESCKERRKKDCNGSVKTTKEIVESLKYGKNQRSNHRIKMPDNSFVYIAEINEIESVPVRCITVDSPNHLFLCGKTHIPTSNTTLVTIYALWLCCFNDDQDIIIVANKESTAKNILKRIQFAYKELDNWLKSGVEEFSKTSMSFSNGSTIKISTTSSDAARGESCSCLILDEAAFIRKEIGDEFFASVVPVISSSSTSKFFMVSTPNGVDNQFYEYYSKGELGSENKHWNGWKTYKTMWYDIPRKKGLDEWKRETIASLGGDLTKWQQEFNCVFIDKGASTLDGAVLEKLRSMCINPLFTYDESDFKVWVEPQPFRTYVMGADVSEGVGQDASTAAIVDITDLKNIDIVATYHSDMLQPRVFAERLFQIARYYGNPLISIESNGVGNSVLDALKNTYNYNYLVNYVKEGQKQDESRLGVFSHTNTKYTAITNMRYWMNTIQCLKLYDINIIKEFETYSRKENGTWGARSGFHDDRIAALYWALFVLETNVFRKYFNILEFDNIGKPMTYIDNLREERSRVGKAPFGKGVFGNLGNAPANILYSGNPMVNIVGASEPQSFQSRGWQILGN